mmetsp:Transcript_55737/g.146595  ORF Transcript_55737/g.146595 Transcript_55737/m.146595 type:complete len:491 (+) Transcript_55737:84-1556(+)
MGRLMRRPAAQVARLFAVVALAGLVVPSAAELVAAPVVAAASHAEVDLSVTRTTYSGPGHEIASAGSSAVAGFFMVVFTPVLLWFNERRQAKMWALFGRARAIALPDVPCDQLDEKNEAHLVHVVGCSTAQGELQDAEFGIGVRDSAKLERTVEMYQWIETVTTSEEKTNTYNYEMGWTSEEVDSSCFHAAYKNPRMPFKGTKTVASRVQLGVFTLTAQLISRMKNWRPLTEAELPKRVSVGGRELELLDGCYTTAPKGLLPRLGDLKVTFQKVPCGDLTVLAVQHNDTFAPLSYAMSVRGGRVVRPEAGREPLLLDRASTAGVLDAAARGPGLDGEALLNRSLEGGCCNCCCNACKNIGALVESSEEVYELEESRVTLAQMLARAEESQQLVHFVLQLLGFFLLVLGFDLIFKFVPTLFRVIPFIGTWIQMFGNGLAACAALLLGGCVWCITVAAAWLSTRPGKALLLLSVAMLLIALPELVASRHVAT